MGDECDEEWFTINCPDTDLQELAGCSTSSTHWWVFLILPFLVFLSALFSGLTLGLLGLDTTALQVIAEGGDVKEKEYANKILPIRKKGNLLLCTLLIGNVVVNSFISILLADLTSGFIGLIVSSGLIVVFGEIIPQAICSRHGLRIGAFVLPLVKIFTFVLYPLAYPISLVLDKALGHDLGTVFSSEELKYLITLHTHMPDYAMESGLTFDDEKMLTGIIDLKEKKVLSYMTHLSRVFKLETTERLDFDNLLRIYRSGFTRIPIFEKEPTNVVGTKEKTLVATPNLGKVFIYAIQLLVTGILFAKDLILLDPADKVQVYEVLKHTGGSHLCYVSEDTTLSEALKLIKSLRIHILLVYGFPAGAKNNQAVKLKPTETENGTDSHLSITVGKILTSTEMESLSVKEAKKLPDGQVVKGIITLEDVIEEAIQDEIIDETDNYIDVNRPLKETLISRTSDSKREQLIAYLKSLNK